MRVVTHRPLLNLRLGRTTSSRPTLTGQTSYGKKIERTETPQVAVLPFVMTRNWLGQIPAALNYVTSERDLALNDI
jgi:hypothetical protein